METYSKWRYRKALCIYMFSVDRLHKNPQASNIDGVFHWTITKDGKVAAEHVLDLKSKPPSLQTGAPKVPVDVSIVLSDEDFMSIVQGKLKAPDAFFKGKMKVKGNIMLAQKLDSILKVGSNL